MSESDRRSNNKEKSSENVENSAEAEPPTKDRKDEWMLRPCDMYYSEYRVCKSLRGKFNQLFVEGDFIDCTPWKTDYDNCTKWQKENDEQAYEKLVESEKNRRITRLTPHVTNDVWKRRQSPPEDWNAPLPQWMVERDAGTLLAAKSHEISTTGDKERELHLPSCTIL